MWGFWESWGGLITNFLINFVSCMGGFFLAKVLIGFNKAAYERIINQQRGVIDRLHGKVELSVEENRQLREARNLSPPKPRSLRNVKELVRRIATASSQKEYPKGYSYEDERRKYFWKQK